jgi:hypothetical protein
VAVTFFFVGRHQHQLAPSSCPIARCTALKDTNMLAWCGFRTANQLVLSNWHMHPTKAGWAPNIHLVLSVDHTLTWCRLCTCCHMMLFVSGISRQMMYVPAF